MMRKFYLFLVLFTIALSGSLYAQSGSGELRGKVVDTKTKEGVPFAGVIVEMNGRQVAAQQSDFDGNYSIKPLAPGTYSVRVKMVGYNERLINGVEVSANRQSYLNPDLVASVTTITTVTVSEFAKPLIERDETATGGQMTAKEISKAPTRNVGSLVSTTAGIYQAEEGAALNIKGSRGDANDIYIDGIKVRGSSVVPNNSIENLSVITGGIPAMYGDATGGIISITTKGPSRTFNGGIEGLTSEFLDGYGYNLVAANLSGPLLKKNKGTAEERSVLGFFISGEFESLRDQDPSYVGAWQANDDWLEYVRNNPRTNLSMQQGTTLSGNPSGDFTTLSNVDKLKAQSDNESRRFNFSGKLDYQPNINSTFTLGFSGSLHKRRLYTHTNMMFNSGNNQEFVQNTYRIFGRYTQKFGNQEDGGSLIKNAYYSIQADYNKDYSVQQDPNHKDDFFKYGYVGKLEMDFNEDVMLQLGVPIEYVEGTDTFQIRYLDFGRAPTDVRFIGGGVNPYLESYNNQIYDYLSENGLGNSFNRPLSYTALQSYGGLVNGENPLSIHGGLFRMPGSVLNLYNEVDRDQYRVSAMASVDIKNHSIQFGIEYEQRVERQYQLTPINLWTYARSVANNHISNPSFTGGLPSGGTVVQDSILVYDFIVNKANENAFSRNFRAKYNIADDAFLNVDAYEPGVFSIDMFDATNLLDVFNSNGPSLTYSGYDYTGKRSSASTSFAKFFDDPNRPVGAFQPIYIAGYIQDKFTFKDMIFNLGVRIDRFDANQMVLKDAYSLFPTHKANEDPSRPSNIGEDYVILVNNPEATDITSAGVIGYRNGADFYDKDGNLVSDLDKIKSGGTPSPWIIGSRNVYNTVGNSSIIMNAYKDYEPKTQIMPRISFSFPISDEANFFASYDVLTQRPRAIGTVFSNPIDYLLLAIQKPFITLVNPELETEKTISYQFGFKQRVSQTSALSFTAFYRELKDNFQIVNIRGSYPASYNTFANQDFGTIKGFTFGYDLRRTNNLQLNAAYTLQFANGTGSNSTSAQTLIQSVSDDIMRIPLPLDYDQRHTLVATIDYRYGNGANYNGPTAARNVLEDMGVNFIFRAGSGTPYSRISQDIVQNVVNLNDTRFRKLLGEVNGSRLPWSFNLDMRLDKDFIFRSTNEEGNAKESTLNIYLMVQNLFDTKRVAAVYHATGLPDDDGYLSTTQANEQLAVSVNAESYIDMYRIRINNPNNYRAPRTIRLGAIYNF